MAITFNSLNPISVGSRAGVFCNFSLDNSYPAGGYDLTAKYLGLASIEMFLPVGNQGGFLYDYNRTTQKLQILQVASTDSGLSSQLSFTVSAADSVRVYYTPGVGTFVPGDAITDTTVVGNTTAVVANVGTNYLDLNLVVGANLFEAGDNIETAGGLKSGIILSPHGTGAPGSDAALYVFTFPNDIWPLGPVVGAASGAGIGSYLDVVSSNGIPAVDTLRMVTESGFLEGELLVTPAVQVTAISSRVLQGGAGAPASAVPTGTDLSAFTNLEAFVIGS